jgi:prephenate dehydratase
LLADEVYAGAEHKGEEQTPSFWGRYERVIAVNSLSKAYALPGLRIGWVVAPPDLVDEIWARQDYITISSTMLANKIAAYALSPEIRPKLIERTRQYVRNGYQNLERWVNSHPEQLSVIPPEAAAIAGRSAAEVYGLPVLFADIEDRPDNTTRFLVIGRQIFEPSGKDKTTLLLSGHEGPGLLYSLLEPFQVHGVNMTRIESRPSRLGKWAYVFFVDIEGHAEDPAVAAALKDLKKVSKLSRVLGSYPRAVLTP